MIVKPPAASSRSPVRSVERPAPLLGLNTDSPITATKPGHALRLDNWVCRSDGLHTRPGYTVVETLAPLAPLASLLHYPGRVFGRTDGYWTGALMPNAGGTHLFATGSTGAMPIRYDGSTWAIAAITGVNPTLLRGVIRHVRRLFAFEAGTLNLWYLGLDAIGGPASLIPLTALCKNKGSIHAIASMTGDGGDKSTDSLVIATTAGELIVFSGSDPDNAASWSLGGVFKVPKVVGVKPFSEIGGKLALLTEQGLLPIPDVLSAPESGKPLVALTKPIKPTFDKEAVAGALSAAVVDSAAHSLTLAHVNGNQFVRSETGGWSRLVGLGATCWLETNQGLYFGRSDGKICKLGGDTDNGAPIRSFLVDAFARLGSADHKHLKRVRGMYLAAHPYVPRMEALTDYRDPPESFDAANRNDRYWQWSEVTWPRQPMPWVRETSSRLGLWRSLSGRGTAVALQMSAQTMTPIIFTGYDIAWETGSAL